MTNGDKIRQMSDEELAEAFQKLFLCEMCGLQNAPCETIYCIEAAKKWFKPEADDAENDR